MSLDVADYRRLVDIGIALGAERNHARLQERILIEAKDLARADGGTLYLRNRDDELEFAILRTDSLDLARGGTTGHEVELPPLPMRDEQGRRQTSHVAVHVAWTGETSVIDDAYETEGFDFSGARAFDERKGYRSQSFLTVPLKTRAGRVVGVLQLINARDEERVGPFDRERVPLVEALAAQAAVCLENHLLLKAQKDLFQSFIELIAEAIDRKSPYTAGHCQRVPVIAQMLADAAMAREKGPLADFTLSADEQEEFRLAAWLHDCGKITTPEHVVDKATRLETVHDRVSEVAARFAVLRLAGALPEGTEPPALADELAEGLAVIERINGGGESLADEDRQRIEALGRLTWPDARGEHQPLLTADELDNLLIGRGTLTASERNIINDHVAVTRELLERLPFPPELARVPEIAGDHHEHVDGSGYPRGREGNELTVQARILAIADVFEALTASDRPYKPPQPLSRALGIMASMRDRGHLDPALFDLFVTAGLPEDYGRRFLRPEQLDAVDVPALLTPS
ncbi:MAG: HD domain-containing phosphohydrolase [Acidobacteriota bacterium]